MTASAAQSTTTALYSQPMGSAEMAREFGLKDDEYQKVLDIMGRTPNMTELGIFSVMWSEHCSYKTTRKHLKNLPTSGPHVICGPGENAGVIDIGDGHAAIFKMESHNHPSYIEPYQGAATGVGGILRDVFTMGARPIANMNALRFGDVSHPKTRHLLSGVVEGIGGYGNCVGVPTVGGEVNFHKSYNGNILVNAMNVGLADANNIFYSAAAGIGNPVVYVGSKTGRDGIHGATMASTEFNEEAEAKRPTVQVGDPFTEKLLIEACLELMQHDAIIAIQDMGAAGLTSSSLEMAGKGGCGIELWLDKVPMRETGMTPYELMLSESQERMLMVLKPEKQDLAREIFEKWELDIATIGTLTDSKHLVLKFNGEVAADIPVDPLSEDAPVYDRPHVPTPKRPNIGASEVPAPKSLLGTLETLLATPDLCSRRWIWEQYDHMVMNDTVVRPGGDASVVRIHGTQKALAISTDCTPRYCEADPEEGGKQAVAETWRNIIASGGKPLAITNCLNFGNPEKPEVMGQIVGALKGMTEACNVLEYPVISGNVSLYNDTDGKSVQPTPAIGGVGVLKDVKHHTTISFDEEGLDIFLIGQTTGHFGSSIYLREIEGREEGAPPPVDLNAELTNGRFVREHIRMGHVKACHDLADGGLLVALAEMCMAGGIGASIELPEGLAPHAAAYGEDQARYILAVPADFGQRMTMVAKEGGIHCVKLGTTGGKELCVEDHGSIAVAKLKEAHEGFLPKYMAGNA